MYILEKLSNPTKKVEAYNVETGAYTETYDNVPPIAFAMLESAEQAMRLINANNDRSNHVQIVDTDDMQTDDTEYGWYVEQTENPEKLFKSWSSTHNPTWTKVQTQAYECADEAEAIALCAELIDFVGTTPVRKPK